MGTTKQENWVKPDAYEASRDQISQWRKEAEDYVRERKRGGLSISPTDIESQWSSTGFDNKKGAIKYTSEDLGAQMKREMATVLNKVMNPDGTIPAQKTTTFTEKKTFVGEQLKQLERIENGYGPSSGRIASALKHDGGEIKYSADLAAVQERLIAAKERGRAQPAWESVRQVVAKAEQAAARAMPNVVETVEKYGGKVAEAVAENGGKAAKYVAQHAGAIAEAAEKNKAVKAAVAVGSAAATMFAAGTANASQMNGVPQETFVEKSWRVAKVGMDDMLPGSKDLIEGRDMCKNAFGVASKGVGELAGAGVGTTVGVVVGGVTTAGAALVTGPVAPVIGATTGFVAGTATADSVSTGTQNIGRKLSGMVCSV